MNDPAKIARAWIAAGASFLAAACQTGPEDRARALGFRLDEAEAAAPLSDAEQSVWEYLSGRYDANGDGKIAAEEYDRGETRFARLDANGDGVIEEDDLRSSRGRGGGRPAVPLGAQVLQKYFDGEDSSAVHRAEISESIDLADEDGDDRLSPAELEILVDRKNGGELGEMYRQSYPGGRYQMLLEAADGDESEDLSRAELLAYFDGLDTDGDGVLESTSPGSRGSRSSSNSGGAPEGEPAPDFTLTRLDTSGTVTLSDHIGDRPVALIFGSYT